MCIRDRRKAELIEELKKAEILSQSVVRPVKPADIQMCIRDRYTAVECPKYKDAGTYNIYYQVTKTGYGQVTGVQQIEIKKKPVTDVTFPITNEVIYGTSLCDIPTTGMQDDYGTFTWMDPVSYTHLDVYKRQVYSSA